MKTVHVGGRPVSAMVLGLMRIAGRPDDEVRRLVGAALDAGVTMIDHADMYGRTLHECERRFAEAMRLTPSQRDALTIQSKVGVLRDGPRYDLSYEHVVAGVEGSLAALRTDRLDVLLLHRPDPLVEPEEVARAVDDLHAAGKVLAFGVSNHTPRQVELLQRHLRQPLVVNQLQLSLTHAPVITQGLVSNMRDEPQATVQDGGGVLDFCRLHDITVQAWSPFQAGFLDGVFLGSPRHPELNAVIDRVAREHGVPPIAVATAWITRHPAGMQVVLGSTTPERVVDACRGADVVLTRVEWYDLLRAAGHRVP